MKKIIYVSLLLTSACAMTEREKAIPDFSFEFDKVAKESKFVSDQWSIWGGSLVKGDDGLYHMYYSRWPKQLGWVWVTHSEIAHAVSKSPLGPFEHRDVALAPRGKHYWDGMTTHNPTVHKFDGKYYLYYMGTTGDKEVIGRPGHEKLNWQHRNNQRIGVAVADHPNGPWKRFNQPVLDVSSNDEAYDSLMTSNPSVTRRPDGGYLMVFKAVGKKIALPKGGPVVHGVALSDSPTGPFKKHDKPIFTEKGVRFPAEDPYIWYQEGRYRAIVKRIEHVQRKRIFSLVHYESDDGLDWRRAKNFLVNERVLTWEDGRTEHFDHLERPQVFIEDGRPVALLCAGDKRDENRVRHSFNVQIPLTVKRTK